MDDLLNLCMDMREKIAAINQRQANFEKEIEKQGEAFKKINELSIFAREATLSLDMVKNRLNKIETKLEAIETKPLKQIQNVTAQLISLVVAGAFGGITTLIFH